MHDNSGLGLKGLLNSHGGPMKMLSVRAGKAGLLMLGHEEFN